jgi:CBS domain-containing protein
VRKVKRSESGLIIDPVTLHVNATIADALKLMKENKIGGIPIVDTSNFPILLFCIAPTSPGTRYSSDSSVFTEISTRASRKPRDGSLFLQ